jgi:predicted aspartyl protease
VIQPVEQVEVGRTIVSVTITNAFDRLALAKGTIDESDVRWESLEVLVDTGATYLSLPISLVHRLGLSKLDERPVRTANGIVQRGIYSSVYLELQGRAAETPIMETPDDIPPLLGVFPLEQLDFVVNPKAQRLEGNPEHGGEFMLEQY